MIILKACDLMLLTQREDLPHEDAEGPDVTLGGVDLVEDGLWCHPFEGQSSLRVHQESQSFNM